MNRVFDIRAACVWPTDIGLGQMEVNGDRRSFEAGYNENCQPKEGLIHPGFSAEERAAILRSSFINQPEPGDFLVFTEERGAEPTVLRIETIEDAQTWLPYYEARGQVLAEGLQAIGLSLLPSISETVEKSGEYQPELSAEVLPINDSIGWAASIKSIFTWIVQRLPW